MIPDSSRVLLSDAARIGCLRHLVTASAINAIDAAKNVDTLSMSARAENPVAPGGFAGTTITAPGSGLVLFFTTIPLGCCTYVLPLSATAVYPPAAVT